MIIYPLSYLSTCCWCLEVTQSEPRCQSGPQEPRQRWNSAPDAPINRTHSETTGKRNFFQMKSTAAFLPCRCSRPPLVPEFPWRCSRLPQGDSWPPTVPPGSAPLRPQPAAFGRAYPRWWGQRWPFEWWRRRWSTGRPSEEGKRTKMKATNKQANKQGRKLTDRLWRMMCSWDAGDGPVAKVTVPLLARLRGRPWLDVVWR